VSTSQRALPDWVRSTDHPIIVRTCHGTTGSMSLEGASPHLVGENRDIFLGALRKDVSACNIEPALPVFRKVPQDGLNIPPETCAPYTDANAFGYYLKNVLPILFVRTTKGDLLPNARVAMKYLRENASQFTSVLDLIEHHARRVFEPGHYTKLKPRYPQLFADVVQPYGAFSNVHMAMGAGCYVRTPPGVATFLGAPINQRAQLQLHSGLMESEWHQSELFLVFDCPEFNERVRIIEPDTVLAQFYFVSKAAQESAEITFSETDLGAEPAYRERSIAVGLDLVERGKKFVVSKTTGVMSLSVACPHCWVSITAAAESGVPEEHVGIQDFYAGYKALRAEYARAAECQALGEKSSKAKAD
jgi:hypothetical protein